MILVRLWRCNVHMKHYTYVKTIYRYALKRLGICSIIHYRSLDLVLCLKCQCHSIQHPCGNNLYEIDHSASYLILIAIKCQNLMWMLTRFADEWIYAVSQTGVSDLMTQAVASRKTFCVATNCGTCLNAEAVDFCKPKENVAKDLWRKWLFGMQQLIEIWTLLYLWLYLNLVLWVGLITSGMEIVKARGLWIWFFNFII